MTLLKRFRSGWPPEEAITTLSAARSDRTRAVVVAFGESKSLQEWESDSRCNVPVETLVQRLLNGWEADSALETPDESDEQPRKSRQKLYFGYNLNHWLRDSRCTVSRATLLRNFELGLPPEEALAYTIRDRYDNSDLRAETVSRALELLESGGEIWQYRHRNSIRNSLILEEQRFNVEQSVLKEMQSAGYLEEKVESSSLSYFRLKGSRSGKLI